MTIEYYGNFCARPFDLINQMRHVFVRLELPGTAHAVFLTFGSLIEENHVLFVIWPVEMSAVHRLVTCDQEALIHKDTTLPTELQTHH